MDRETESLAKRVGVLLSAGGWTVTTAESCTGGGVASAITAIPGCSQWFEGGYISYANHIKESMLGVSSELIVRYGAVSEQVVTAMALRAAEKANADFAVAISGVAGPTGGTLRTPVGTVWFACRGSRGVVTEKHLIQGDRSQVRDSSVKISLRQLLHQLQ